MNIQAIGLGIVILGFLIAGVGHFVWTDFYVGIMPPYIPWHRPLVYISGALEIAGAVALCFPALRPDAGQSPHVAQSATFSRRFSPFFVDPSAASGRDPVAHLVGDAALSSAER
jgi:hypothetical protein